MGGTSVKKAPMFPPVKHPPVIIIGMHRSGTTLITDILNQLGLFAGWFLQENAESNFFVERNERLLEVCSGNWEHPEAIDQLLNHVGVREAAARQLWADLHSRRNLSFLGLRNYLKYRSTSRLPFVWGWKDPRNSYLLPLWLDLFPTAKIIHIYRNGIDVAQSLVVRGNRSIGDNVHRQSTGGVVPLIRRAMGRQKMERSTLLFLYRRIQAGLGRLDSLHRYARLRVPATQSREAAFDLWQRYVGRCFDTVKGIDNPVLTVKYEDFLDDPAAGIERLCEFCGLPCEQTRLEPLIAAINPDRKYGFQRDPELRAFYESVRGNPWMQTLGYGELSGE